MRRILLILFFVLSLFGVSFSADQTLIDKSEVTSITDAILYVIVDPGGTPLDRKITYANLKAQLVTDGYTTDDGVQTITNKTIDADNNTITNVGLSEIDSEVSGFFGFYNGTFKESFNALVTSDGTTITMSIQSKAAGDLTERFSDGFTTFDCTPAATIALTAGTSSSPQANYIYVLQSTKALTKSTTQWPSAEHIKVGYFYVQTAALVQSTGALISQNWNDAATENSDSMGHVTHIGRWIRSVGAKYFSGCDGGGTSGYLTPGAGGATFQVNAGVISQMHLHSYGAKDTSGTDIALCPNYPSDAFKAIDNINDLLVDSDGDSLTGRYFNIIIGGVANKGGEYSPLMIKLPSGSYNSSASAIDDVDTFTDYAMPRQFNKESSTGFLIARVTVRNQSDTTFTVMNTQDLRGTDGALPAGNTGGTILTDYADNQFTIYNNVDATKVIDFAASGITTGNTRTITMADVNIDLTPGSSFETADAAITKSDEAETLSSAWDMGTPSALVGTNISAMPYTGLANGTDGQLITWAADATVAVVAVGTAAQVLTSNGVGAAPTFQAAGGGDALVANPLSQFAATTSAQLAGVISDETGDGGGFVRANNATLVTPALGTPASGVVTNLTGTASININGTVGATTPAAGAFTTLSATGGITADSSVLPTLTFKDSDLLGADEEAAKIFANATTFTDGGEVTDLTFTYMNAGTVTNAIIVDGSDNQVEVQINTTFQAGDIILAELGGGTSGAHVWDFGGATSFELPNSATPTVDADGEIALDTTITSHDGLLVYYQGAEAMVIPAIPLADLTTTDGHVIDYNSAGTKFTMDAPAAGGETNSLEVLTTGILTTEIPIGTAADTVVYAALGGDVTMANNGVVTIANNAVENVMMADNSIDSDEYVDGSIDTVHIAADQITSALIADDQIDSEHYVAASIDSEHLSTSAQVVNTITSFASPTTANPYTLVAANSYNFALFYGATGEIDLPAGVDGMSGIIYNTGAFTITIDPNGTEIIVRTGTVQTGGVSMTLSSGAGNFVSLVFDGTRWITIGFNGTLAVGT